MPARVEGVTVLRSSTAMQDQATPDVQHDAVDRLTPDASACDVSSGHARHSLLSIEPYCVRQARQAHVRQLPGLSRARECDWTP